MPAERHVPSRQGAAASQAAADPGASQAHAADHPVAHYLRRDPQTSGSYGRRSSCLIDRTKTERWHRDCTLFVRSRTTGVIAMPKEDLRNNDMMSRLMDALEQRQDIGHYGRLVFAMIGRHFLEDDEL